MVHIKAEIIEDMLQRGETDLLHLEEHIAREYGVDESRVKLLDEYEVVILPAR